MNRTCPFHLDWVANSNWRTIMEFINDFLCMFLISNNLFIFGAKQPLCHVVHSLKFYSYSFVWVLFIRLNHFLSFKNHNKNHLPLQVQIKQKSSDNFCYCIFNAVAVFEFIWHSHYSYRVSLVFLCFTIFNIRTRLTFIRPTSFVYDEKKNSLTTAAAKKKFESNAKELNETESRNLISTSDQVELFECVSVHECINIKFKFGLVDYNCIRSFIY